MTGEERNQHGGEDYADYLVDYRTNPNIAELFPEAFIHKINDTYEVIHIPVSEFPIQMQRNARTLILPTVYTLTSEISVEASGIQRIRAIPGFNQRGNGVLIGIIDTGVKYTLPALKKQDGKTKIAALWDQTITEESSTAQTMNFGTEYSEEQINQALAADNPLTVVPSTDENGHGTMLAAVAAGTEDARAGFYGVAPEADLIVVKLAQAKQYLRNFYAVPDGVVCYQDNYIMWGIQFCQQTARRLNRPLSLCIGIGTSLSSHTGTSPLSQQLSRVADSPQTGVVISAGNEGNLSRHFHGTIDPAIGSTSVELNVGEKDKGFTMQLWGAAPGIYSIDILSPSGEFIPRMTPGLYTSRRITFIFEQTIIYVSFQTVEPTTGDELIMLNFHNATSGTWKFTVYEQGNLTGDFHIWLPMGDFISRDTYFTRADNYTTILTPGSANVPITVTAYNPVGNVLYTNASRGFTRTDLVKPELAAPGVNYLAPTLDGGYTNYTGTGVASAHTAGIAALFLEWGVIKGNLPDLDTLEMKKYLIRGAKRIANLTYPNRDWGYGIIDVYNTFDVLRIST